MKHRPLIFALLALFISSCNSIKPSSSGTDVSTNISVTSPNTSNVPESITSNNSQDSNHGNSTTDHNSESLDNSPEIPSESPSISTEIPPSTSPSDQTSTTPSVPPSTSPSDQSSTAPSVPPSTSPGGQTSTAPSIPPSTTPSVPPSTTPSIPDSSTSGQFGDENVAKYYQSIDFSKNGQELLSQLRSLNSSKITNKPGYNGLWNYYNKTDYDPNDRSKYIAFYRGTSAPESQMNKEHVWPKSHGGNLVEGDLHMTRPTLNSDNSSRGNSFYVEGKVHSSNGWDPYAAGMTEYYRGIAARIIFYCVVASPQLSLIDEDSHPTTNANRDNMMGKLSDLLKWNLEYDIDYTEINRNEGIEDIQHNRNPFIDDRTLACKVWGDYNDNTRRVCSSAPSTNDPVAPTSIGITPNNATIKVGNTQQLSVSASPFNAIKTVTWETSNPNVATVNNGVVTGISEGSATITAISTENPSITATSTITVINSEYVGNGEYSYTFSSAVFGANPTNETKTLENIEWSMTHDGNYAGYDGNKGAQFGSGNNPATSLELSTSDITGTITEITINASGASSTNAKLTITVGDIQYGETVNLTNTATNYVFAGSSSGKIIITMTQTSKKALYIKSINIKYTK